MHCCSCHRTAAQLLQGTCRHCTLLSALVHAAASCCTALHLHESAQGFPFKRKHSGYGQAALQLSAAVQLLLLPRKPALLQQPCSTTLLLGPAALLWHMLHCPGACWTVLLLQLPAAVVASALQHDAALALAALPWCLLQPCCCCSCQVLLQSVPMLLAAAVAASAHAAASCCTASALAATVLLLLLLLLGAVVASAYAAAGCCSASALAATVLLLLLQLPAAVAASVYAAASCCTADSSGFFL
jgi:hypothetical protein